MCERVQCTLCAAFYGLNLSSLVTKVNINRFIALGNFAIHLNYERERDLICQENRVSECVRGKGGDGLAREEEKEVKSLSKDLDLVY